MTRSIQDWLNAYIDALLGERAASAIAGEAHGDEEARLMKTARRLKYQAGKEGLEPRPEFAARLEKELREELAKARPKVRRMPSWRLSWPRALAGTAAAAAVFMAFLLLRTGTFLPTAPQAAPAALRQEAAPAASPAIRAAPAAPEAASSQPSWQLAEPVAKAQTILLGQVVEVSAQAFAAPYDARVVISVQRYLKGPLPSTQVTLAAASNPALGAVFSPGERVLVMAGDLNKDGYLETLPYPQAKYIITPDGQAVATGGGAKALEGAERLSVEEVISRIEGLLKGNP